MNLPSPFRLKDLLAETRESIAVAAQALVMARQIGWKTALSPNGRAVARETPAVAIVGISLTAALVSLLRRAGHAADPQGLCAALPMSGEDLDPRVAPLALARFQLQARWERRPLSDILAGDFPCILRLNEGGFVVALSPPEDGHMRVLTPGADSGEVGLVGVERLALAFASDVLITGVVDPVNGDNAAEERDAMRAAPKMWILARFLEDRRLLGQLVIAALLLNLCSLAMPMYQRAIYDRVVPNLAMESLWALSIGILIALAFEFMLRNVRADFIEAAGLRVSHLVQHRVMSGLLAARPGSTQRTSGDLNVALRDIDGLAYLVPLALVTFVVDIPFFFIWMLALWLIGGPLALVAMFGALMIALTGLVSASSLGRLGKRTSNLMRARINQIEDAVDGMQTLKTNQAEGRFMRDWTSLSDHSALAGHGARQWSEWSGGVIGMSVQGVMVFVLVVGVYQMQAGLITVGGLIACTMMAGRAMTPISTATSILARAHQALAQFGSLAELIALPPEKDAPTASIGSYQPRGAIELRNVRYGYEEDGRPALDGLTLKIAPGERIALIGKSGSGKSTLLQMCAGLIEPQQGAILFDSFSGDQYGVSRLRSAISFASQDAIVFDASLKDNVTLGAPHASEAELIAAVAITGVDQIAATLPNGFGTRLGARGSRLSAGQRQAVVLARALARKSTILLLDEPTASLDSSAEQRVREGLMQLPRDRTLILSTHRMELLSVVDRVIWLEAGRVQIDEPTAQVIARLREAGMTRQSASAPRSA
jgi:ATP-binding cassette subfamily C protein LapB